MAGGALGSGTDPLFVEIRWGSRPALNPNGRYTQLYSVLCIPGGDTYHDLVGDQVICVQNLQARMIELVERNRMIPNMHKPDQMAMIEAAG